MKLYISVDLEGVSGVVHGDQLGSRGHDYDRARRLMTEEANAAVEGALAAGATEVVLNDGHGSARNLLIEELHPDAELITGPSISKQLAQMEGIDESYDGVFFVGYHSQAGTAGVLNHTISGSTVYHIELNGTPVGETGINAGIAGAFGVPLLLVAGDSTVCEEAQSLNDGVVAVPVKKAIGRYAARCVSPEKAREAIREGAQRAVEQHTRIEPTVWEEPTTVSLQFVNTAMADIAELIPGVTKQDPLTITYTGENCAETFKVMRACIFLGQATTV
jgi:D-amino peptidase